MVKTILIIEDEAPIRDMLQFTLSQAGFAVLTAEDGKRAMLLLASQIPDLILIDWMLPGMSGIDIARQLKKDPHTADIPLIMLTAKASEDNKIKGLETGADDYVVKPFSPRELIARINAVLRRVFPTTESIQYKDLCLELVTQRVTLKEIEIKMGAIEYRLLRFLMSHPEKVYSRDMLLDRVWGKESDIDDRSVDVCIRRIRKALGSDYQRIIETVHGSGYRYSPAKLL